MRRSLALAIAALLGASPAAAQPNNKDAADDAFREAKALIGQGNVRAACVKFEQSLTLMEQLGVRLNLADCYERLTRLTAARDTFRAAEASAVSTRDPRLPFIRDRLVSLEKRIPTLIIAVAPNAEPIKVDVKRNDQVVPPNLLGVPFRVDPGAHVIRAAAPGFQPWSIRITAAEGSRSTVNIPALRPLQAGATPAATPPPPRATPAAIPPPRATPPRAATRPATRINAPPTRPSPGTGDAPRRAARSAASPTRPRGTPPPAPAASRTTSTGTTAGQPDGAAGQPATVAGQDDSAPGTAVAASLTTTTEEPGRPGLSRRTRQSISIGTAGVGVFALGVGIYLGLGARSDWNDLVDSGACNEDGKCENADVLPEARSARSRSVAGHVLGGVGLAAVVTGASLYVFWAGRADAEVDTTAGARLAPVLGPDLAGFALTGEF